MNTKSKTYRLVIRAILTAIIILQTMVPFLGFIPIGITSLTIIHITVIVAAIVLGTKDGMFIGLVWGIFTMIRAFTSPTSPLDIAVFTNPIISVVPRIGWISGWSLVYDHLQKDQKSRRCFDCCSNLWDHHQYSFSLNVDGNLIYWLSCHYLWCRCFGFIRDPRWNRCNEWNL